MEQLSIEPGVKDGLMTSDARFISNLIIHLVFYDNLIPESEKSQHLSILLEMMKTNRCLVKHALFIAKREYESRKDISVWREQSAFVCIFQTVFRTQSSVTFCEKVCQPFLKKLCKSGKISDNEMDKLVVKFVKNIAMLLQRKTFPIAISSLLQVVYQACYDVRAIGLFVFVRFFCPFFSHPDRVVGVKDSAGCFSKIVTFSKKLNNYVQKNCDVKYYQPLIDDDDKLPKQLPNEMSFETYQKCVESLFKYVRHNKNQFSDNRCSKSNNSNNEETEFWRSMERSGRLKKSSSTGGLITSGGFTLY